MWSLQPKEIYIVHLWYLSMASMCKKIGQLETWDMVKTNFSRKFWTSIKNVFTNHKVKDESSRDDSYVKGMWNDNVQPFPRCIEPSNVSNVKVTQQSNRRYEIEIGPTKYLRMLDGCLGTKTHPKTHSQICESINPNFHFIQISQMPVDLQILNPNSESSFFTPFS